MTVTTLINCACDDLTGYRTLAQLRSDVLAACGFIDPLNPVGGRTRAQLRTEMRAMLGLADPITGAQTRTLTVLRAEVHRMLGFAAQGVDYGPGMSALIDDWINEAQAMLWRRLELDKGAAALPPRLVVDADLTTLDYVPILSMAVALGKANYESSDAKVYMEQTEKQLADFAARNPPGLTGMLNAMLSQAHDTILRRVEGIGDGAVAGVAGTFDTDADVPLVDAHAVLLLALASMKAKVGQADTKLQWEMYTRYMDDLEKRMPASARRVVLSSLKSANRQLYYRYDSLRTERYFSWVLTANIALYDLPNNAEICSKELNALKLTYVGVQDATGSGWRKLQQGIAPNLLGNTRTGRPERFEIRQCIQVWPVPATTAGHLVVKGHFGPEAFAADIDKPTVDDELVFLLAVALTKAHFKQPDAQNYVQMMETHLRKLVAGSHGTDRYIPGYPRDVDHNYVEPKFIGPGAW